MSKREHKSKLKKKHKEHDAEKGHKKHKREKDDGGNAKKHKHEKDKKDGKSKKANKEEHDEVQRSGSQEPEGGASQPSQVGDAIDRQGACKKKKQTRKAGREEPSNFSHVR